jgi:hypothetical protein
VTDHLTTARRLLVGAQRASKAGDAAAALELTLAAASYLRLTKLFESMNISVAGHA